MSGILFLNSEDIGAVKSFYATRLDMSLWLDQGDCVILQHDNFLLGFCQRESWDFPGILTLFYEREELVDAMYDRLSDIAEGEPMRNEEYRVYHFFGRDPEGRRLEFQSFLHPLRAHMGGVALLRTRRSIRQYAPGEVPEGLLWEVFEICRWLPTSRNSQAYTYTVLRDRARLEKLAEIRGSSSAPIANAPMAVGVSTNPEESGRPIQDACIAAYHLTLAAHLNGLGTCWIGDMNREAVKDLLNIPVGHYLATVMPMGYPAEWPDTKERRQARAFVRFIG